MWYLRTTTTNLQMMMMTWMFTIIDNNNDVDDVVIVFNYICCVCFCCFFFIISTYYVVSTYLRVQKRTKWELDEWMTVWMVEWMASRKCFWCVYNCILQVLQYCTNTNNDRKICYTFKDFYNNFHCWEIIIIIVINVCWGESMLLTAIYSCK